MARDSRILDACLDPANAVPTLWSRAVYAVRQHLYICVFLGSVSLRGFTRGLAMRQLVLSHKSIENTVRQFKSSQLVRSYSFDEMIYCHSTFFLRSTTTQRFKRRYLLWHIAPQYSPRVSQHADYHESSLSTRIRV